MEDIQAGATLTMGMAMGQEGATITGMELLGWRSSSQGQGSEGLSVTCINAYINRIYICLFILLFFLDNYVGCKTKEYISLMITLIGI
jgi:hypothetical protein